MTTTCATSSTTASARGRTLRAYRLSLHKHVLPVFANMQIEDVTTAQVEHWLADLGNRALSNRARSKILTVFHGVMERARKVHKLPDNPVKDVEKPRAAPTAGIDVFTPEEVFALARAAESEQDAAIFLTAAFPGLRRGELVALRWRDIDFAGEHIRVVASYVLGELSTPKSGKVRSVPMAPVVAKALAGIAQREHRR